MGEIIISNFSFCIPFLSSRKRNYYMKGVEKSQINEIVGSKLIKLKLTVNSIKNYFPHAIYLFFLTKKGKRKQAIEKLSPRICEKSYFM